MTFLYVWLCPTMSWHRMVLILVCPAFCGQGLLFPYGFLRSPGARHCLGVDVAGARLPESPWVPALPSQLGVGACCERQGCGSSVVGTGGGSSSCPALALTGPQQVGRGLSNHVRQRGVKLENRPEGPWRVSSQLPEENVAFLDYRIIGVVFIYSSGSRSHRSRRENCVVNVIVIERSV